MWYQSSVVSSQQPLPNSKMPLPNSIIKRHFIRPSLLHKTQQISKSLTSLPNQSASSTQSDPVHLLPAHWLKEGFFFLAFPWWRKYIWVTLPSKNSSSTGKTLLSLRYLDIMIFAPLRYIAWATFVVPHLKSSSPVLQNPFTGRISRYCIQAQVRS